MRLVHRLCMPGKRTAFDWRAYLNRRGGLRLLRQGKVHVDTLISTQDGFSDTVHWQVIVALFPDLIDASQLSQTNRFNCGKLTQWRQLILPARVNGLMARKLLECAYGERVILDRGCLREFYLLARDYNISYVTKCCLNHAKSLLDIQNCIQLLLVSLKHRHHRLRRASYLMIRSNFKLILHVNDDFHLLDPNYLKRLLLDDFLKLNEDEEFAWLAIVRWAQQRSLTLRELIDLYNQMVAVTQPQMDHAQWPPTPNQRRAGGAKEYFRPYMGGNLRNIGNPQLEPTTLNFYTQSVPLDWISGSEADNKSTSISKHSRTPLELDDLVPLNSVERQRELFNLIRCLRFMRFRSLNAFNVILAHDLVRGDERLEQLVNHMRLIYMVRKKLPLDKGQLELIMPGRLDKIKLDEMSGPKRALKLALKLATGFVKCNGSRFWAATGGGIGTSKIPPSTKNPSKLKANEAEDEQQRQQHQEAAQMMASDFGLLADECLKWADKPRVPNSVALLIGGWQDGVVSKSLVAYDFICDKWFKLNIRLPEPRAFHASCCLPKTSQIFILGGTNGETILDSVLRFDPASDILTSSRDSHRKLRKSQKTNDRGRHCQFSYRFHSLCPMSERRCHLSGVFHSDGRLYALGGHNGQQRLRSGEWYDTKMNRWHPIAEMTIARSDASACSHDNKIFIAGGQISDQFIQSSVEFYKANDDTWTFAAPMIVPRMSFRLVSFRNLLLAIGGTNGLMGGDEIGSVTRSVERYNPNQSTWSLCTPLGQKRSSFGVMNIEDNLIVAGGYGGRGRLKTCESLKIGHFIDTNTQQQPPGRPPIRLGSIPAAGTTSQLNSMPNLNAQQPNNGRLLLPLNSNNNRPLFGLRAPASPIRSAMKWVRRADLPTKRSGFSMTVAGPLWNAKELTYHGSKRPLKGPCVVKQRSRWHRLKIIKRRKLIKHLKIALVVTVVILIM